MQEITYAAGLYRRPLALNSADASTGPGAWDPGSDVAGVCGLSGLSGGAGSGLEGRPAKLAQGRGFRSTILLEKVSQASRAARRLHHRRPRACAVD